MTAHTESIPYLSPVWPHYTPIVASRAEGCYMYDQDGTAYLDFTCGIGVTNTGHCHPKVVEAIQKQAGLLLHGQANIVIHEPLLELVHEMRKIVHPSLDGFFFTNSGAEAVEGAMKLARHATGRPNIIVFQGSFHGRTVGTMSLTTSKDNLPYGLPTINARGVRSAIPLCLSLWLGRRSHQPMVSWRSWNFCLLPRRLLTRQLQSSSNRLWAKAVTWCRLPVLCAVCAKNVTNTAFF